jgi:immune inhibitor A
MGAATPIPFRPRGRNHTLREECNLRRVTVAALAAAVYSLFASLSAFAGPPATPRSDNLTSPPQSQQAALVQKGLALKASGAVGADASTVKIGRGAKAKYVQLAQTGHSDIFVILAQFGNQINPTTGGTPGPLANQIPKPDRTVDNTTIWFDGGYTPMHYQQLYFDHTPGANSVTNYYQLQSSGRFNFDGAVTDWVTVPFNEARYGTDLCGSTVCTTVWSLLRDAADQWVVDQLASGKTIDQIKAYLAQFDSEDRYDYNHNGNFEEPDGYIDHFQLIHAGEGEETGGGAQGADAIWSHRWYSFQQFIGTRGPANGFLNGGFEIGASKGHPTGFWVGDYVMENENAGVGVVAHETGHDYGLPDEYDTSGSGEAPSAWWTIMSQGSYGNDGKNGIGNRPVDFNAWDKFQLGWLNYRVVDPFADGKSELKLGPSEYNTADAQGVIVKLPKKQVDTTLGKPTEGTHAAYSGTGDNFDSTATRSVPVPSTGATLSFDAWYDMEQDWDYTFVEVSTDNGATWHDVKTSHSDDAANDQSGFNSDGTGISGTSGAGRLDDWYTGRPAPAWVNVTADLSAYAGKTVLLRFEYVTDGASHGQGFEFDNLKLGTFTDGLESDANWTFDGGFHLTTGVDSNMFDNYYVVENRQYVGYDTGLVTSPYNFFDQFRPNWVEKYPYDDGVLVSYWDTSQGDNNTGEHPGSGLILPIDQHQTVIRKDDGSPARTRIQVYDATLSTTPTRSFYLHNGATGGTYRVRSEFGIRRFDDRNSYWNPEIPDTGVKTPGWGVVIDLKNISSQGVAQLSISAAKNAPAQVAPAAGAHARR